MLSICDFWHVCVHVACVWMYMCVCGHKIDVQSLPCWNIQFQLVWLSSLFQGLGNALPCLGFISRLSDLSDCYVGSEI